MITEPGIIHFVLNDFEHEISIAFLLQYILPSMRVGIVI